MSAVVGTRGNAGEPFLDQFTSPSVDQLSINSVQKEAPQGRDFSTPSMSGHRCGTDIMGISYLLTKLSDTS